ncbi:MAG: hypothetical protein JNL10_13025 [Verrucomicrobiales bacterium]|nr:hypothetical protein [Verrucomicrobiales bacterium]
MSAVWSTPPWSNASAAICASGGVSSLEFVRKLVALWADVNARLTRDRGRHGAKAEVWNRKNKYGWTPIVIAEGRRPGNFKPSAETVEALRP